MESLNQAGISNNIALDGNKSYSQMEEHKKSENIPKNKSSMYSSNYKEGGGPENSFEVNN